MAKGKRRPPAGAPAEESLIQPIRWGGVAVTAAMVALALIAGLGLQEVAAVRPSGPVSACRTAAEIAPRQFIGPPRMCIDGSKTYIVDLYTNRGEVSIVLPAQASPVTENNF